jgi:hypothetical protein
MPTDEEAWLRAEREHAVEYLREQRVEHLGVGERPAFHVRPYLALWAVQSNAAPGRVGWWTITGDLPADYVSSSEGRHPRQALRAFARRWLDASEFLLRGESHPDYSVGAPEQRSSLGNLLRRRAEVVQTWADDDELWPGDDVRS